MQSHPQTLRGKRPQALSQFYQPFLDAPALSCASSVSGVQSSPPVIHTALNREPRGRNLSKMHRFQILTPWLVGPSGATEFAIVLKHGVSNYLPIVKPFYRVSGIPAQPIPKVSITQDRDYCFGERLGRISYQNVLAIARVKTFASHLSAYHGFPHRPRIKDFESSPAASAKRCDVACRPLYKWADIGQVAGEFDSEPICVMTSYGFGRATNPRDRLLDPLARECVAVLPSRNTPLRLDSGARSRFPRKQFLVLIRCQAERPLCRRHLAPRHTVNQAQSLTSPRDR